MIGIGFVEMVLLFGFPSDLPLGMPPGPEDPKVACSAPDECLAFVSWVGTAKASPDSKNRTERFLADPEIRGCLEELKVRLKAAVLQGAGSGEKSKAVAHEIPTLVEIALSEPAAFFVENFAPTPPVPAVSAGLVIRVGERADDFRKSWEIVEENLGQKSVVENGGGVEWHVMPGPARAGIDARWTVVKGYFVLAFGAETGPKILARMEAEKPAEWLAEVRKRLDVPRVSTVSFVNVKRIVGLMQQSISQVRPQQAEIFEKLGLTKIESLASVSGLDETGVLSRTWLKLDGRPAVFLKALDSKPLSATDLKAIPADATLAAAVRFDPERTMKEFQALVDVLGPRPGDAVPLFREFDAASAEIGFSIREDLIPALGDTWRVYHSPREGGSLFTNWTAVISVRDPKKMTEIATVVEFKARETRRKQRELNAGQRGGRFVTIERQKVGEQSVSYMNFVGQEFPVAPAWCFTGKELVVSTFPQGVQSYLRRGDEHTSLADLPHVAPRLEGDQAPIALIHFDSAEVCKALYPLALHFGNVVLSQLQREGLDVDISQIPTLPAFLRHLQPASTSLVSLPDGLEIASRRTLPLSVGPSGLTVPAFAMAGFRRSPGMAAPRMGLVDALSPEKAMEAKSKNNMKRIGLAMHNFHDTFGKFPAAATLKNDKPLLSWRVQILPFIDQPLFEKFKQDEPWDSPHNKALISQMPEFLKAPGSKAGEGKTNYLTVRGDGTIFPASKAISLREIKDGATNTVMVVEVADEAAVTWTAPDDFPLDEKDPMKNLVGLRRDGFLAGMADGSVRFISSKVTAETVLMLFLRNDGKAIPSF